MQDLRIGRFDVLIGVNLLREGLDLPEVSLVAIIDADKEGFLRSSRSLTQTVGRAARNINGKAIMYADRLTKSMDKTINETNYRRKKQKEYNFLNNKNPQPLNKSLDNVLSKNSVSSYSREIEEQKLSFSIKKFKKKDDFEKAIRETRIKMEKAAKELDFLKAASLRDEIKFLRTKKNKL